tara:strand:- start:2095 stop:2712 length:618 start_codon:yes stop_codon:yes gene_type:complete
MSSFTLTNIATDIDSAIKRVVGADTSPTTASQNMVTSGGVKAAIDAIGSGSAAIITTDSFTDASLEDSAEGLTSTDTAVPTSKAVKEYVSNQSLVTIKEFPVTLPGGRRTGHPSNTNYHNTVTVNIPGFSQILHIEITPKSHGTAVPTYNGKSVMTSAQTVTTGFVWTFDNSSATFAGPLGTGSVAVDDTGNGYTTTYRVFGIES